MVGNIEGIHGAFSVFADESDVRSGEVGVGRGDAVAEAGLVAGKRRCFGESCFQVHLQEEKDQVTVCLYLSVCWSVGKRYRFSPPITI